MKLTNNVIMGLGTLAVIILVVVGFQHNKTQNRQSAVAASKASVSSEKAAQKAAAKKFGFKESSSSSSSSSSTAKTGLDSSTASSKKASNSELIPGTYVVGKNLEAGSYNMVAKNGSFKVVMTTNKTSTATNEFTVNDSTQISTSLEDGYKLVVTQVTGNKGSSSIQLTAK